MVKTEETWPVLGNDDNQEVGLRIQLCASMFAAEVPVPAAPQSGVIKSREEVARHIGDKTSVSVSSATSWGSSLSMGSPKTRHSVILGTNNINI